MDELGTDKIHECSTGKHAVLDGFTQSRRSRHTYPLLIKGCGFIQGDLSTMETDIDDGPPGHTKTRVVLGVSFEGRQETVLLQEIRGVTGPAFGHGAPTEHGDPRSTIDGRNLPNARSGATGMPVLNMMAGTAVMNDMVELDDAVISRPQETFLLFRRHLHLDRSYEIVKDGNLVER